MEPGVFQFIIVRHNHLSWITEVENALHSAYPDRKLSRLKLPLGFRQGLQYKAVAQESGFLLVDNFEKILEDDSARINFNQRRDLLSQYPIALIVFVPDSMEIVRKLQKGIKDFWSIRNLEIELRREGQSIIDFSGGMTVDYSGFGRTKPEKIEEFQRLKLRIADLESDPSTLSYRADMAYSIGRILGSIGRFDEAILWHSQALRQAKEINDRRLEAKILNSLAQIHGSRGEEEIALSYSELSLVISQVLGDKSGESNSLNNISRIYRHRGEDSKALQLLEKSLEISKEIEDRPAEGTILNNIAPIYLAQKKADEAMVYLQRSLQIRREINDRAGEAATLNNISQVHVYNGDFESALELLLQSLQIAIELDDQLLVAGSSYNIGWILFEQRKVHEATSYFYKAHVIYTDLGSRNLSKVDLYLHQIQEELGPTRYQEIIDSLAADEHPSA